MNKKKNNKGFSLIELIIAIAILIILTGLLAPQFMKYIEKSRLAKDMQTLDTVYTAVQGAIADEDAYQALVVEMAKTNSAINTEEGDSLENLMTEAKYEKFAKELTTLLGKDATVINESFQSKLAAKATKTENSTTTKGKVYVSIDDNMQIVVAFGATAKAPATDGSDSLSVGSNGNIPPTTPTPDSAD